MNDSQTQRAESHSQTHAEGRERSGPGIDSGPPPGSPRESAGSLAEGEWISRHKGRSGRRRLWNALIVSLEGFGSCLKHETAFRQETLLAVVAIPLACLLPFTFLAKAILIASMMGVLVVELLNSAVEWAVDYMSPEDHPIAKRIKDMAGAAVLMSLVNAVVMWVLVTVAQWERLGL